MPLLRCFPPLIGPRSRVLVLGSMPGPVALRRREYYGYPHNHFWKIMAELFRGPAGMDYARKKKLILDNRLALWDVIASCRRVGAADSTIAGVRPNDLPGLLRRYPGIRAIFLNGRLAEKLFRENFAHRIDRPVFYLPSTSPALASLSYRSKLARWKAILKFIR